MGEGDEGMENVIQKTWFPLELMGSLKITPLFPLAHLPFSKRRYFSTGISITVYLSLLLQRRGNYWYKSIFLCNSTRISFALLILLRISRSLPDGWHFSDVPSYKLLSELLRIQVYLSWCWVLLASVLSLASNHNNKTPSVSTLTESHYGTILIRNLYRHCGTPRTLQAFWMIDKATGMWLDWKVIAIWTKTKQ